MTKTATTAARPIARTIPDACRELGISRATAYRLVAKGDLEARKIGGRTVIADASICAFLENAPRAQIGRNAV